MSTITVTENGGGGGSGGFVALGCAISPPAPAMGINRDRMFLAGNVDDDGDGDLGSCSSSSIGKNSDDEEEEEVESKYKCGGEDNGGNNSGSFDAIQALEEALPFRRGISRFYNGKSKSFTSLTDASPLPSVKDIVKPENAYTRKRRNLLASTLLWEDKERGDSDERISKRSCTNANRTTTFAFAVAMNNSANSNMAKDPNPNNQLKQSQLNVSSAHIRSLSTLRSFSMVDLQRCQ